MFGVRISSSTKCSNWPLKAKANTHCTRSYAQFESCNTTPWRVAQMALCVTRTPGLIAGSGAQPRRSRARARTPTRRHDGRGRANASTLRSRPARGSKDAPDTWPPDTKLARSGATDSDHVVGNAT